MQPTSNVCISIVTAIKSENLETERFIYAYFVEIESFFRSMFCTYSIKRLLTFIYTHSCFILALFISTCYSEIVSFRGNISRNIIPTQNFLWRTKENILLRKSLTLLWCFEVINADINLVTPQEKEYYTRPTLWVISDKTWLGLNVCTGQSRSQMFIDQRCLHRKKSTTLIIGLFICNGKTIFLIDETNRLIWGSD